MIMINPLLHDCRDCLYFYKTKKSENGLCIIDKQTLDGHLNPCSTYISDKYIKSFKNYSIKELFLQEAEELGEEFNVGPSDIMAGWFDYCKLDCSSSWEDYISFIRRRFKKDEEDEEESFYCWGDDNPYLVLRGGKKVK